MNEPKFIPKIKIDVKDLPSKGKTYPRNAEISYRGYLFGEIQEINSSKGRTFLDNLKSALSGITCVGMNVTDITLPDAVYLAILRRMSSCGTSDFEIKYICGNPSCKKVNSRVFNQNSISFNDLAIDGEGIELELSDGNKYAFKPMTYGDFLALTRGNKDIKNGQDLTRDKVAVMAVMVRNRLFSETYNNFFNLTSDEDFELLNEINSMLHHDLQPLSHKCDSCGFENSVTLEGRDSLITPFRKGGKSLRERIHIIKRTEPKSLSHEDDGV